MSKEEETPKIAEEEEDYDPQFEFFECCRYGDEDCGISILQSFPEVDPCIPDEYGTTPLHAVSANGLVRLLTEIIKLRPGLNLNVKTEAGNTPLHYAAINRNSKIIKILVDAGANTKEKNEKGQSPLYEAVQQMADGKGTEAETVDLLVGPDSEIPENLNVPIEEGDLA